MIALPRRAAAAAVLLPLALVPATARAQKAVFVVRHAEKATEASDPSVPLSAGGKVRAQKLAAMLKDAGITAIYSTDYVRTRATAEPLANALHEPIHIYSAKDAAGRPSPSSLLETLRKEPQAVVLVVGHSDTVPGLLSALGVQEKVEIATQEYDNLFIVVPKGSDQAILVRLRF